MAGEGAAVRASDAHAVAAAIGSLRRRFMKAPTQGRPDPCGHAGRLRPAQHRCNLARRRALGARAKVLAVPRLPLTVLAVAAAALPGCAAVQAADQDPPATAAAGVRADTLAGVARRIYRQEAAGAVGHAAVKRLARDRALNAAMRGNRPAALRAAAL